eukprot:m.153137 g.153137  ORF g.153137 m.153137 type:complete len:72 (+) comp14344_c0_seq1:341-556(+)
MLGPTQLLVQTPSTQAVNNLKELPMVFSLNHWIKFVVICCASQAGSRRVARPLQSPCVCVCACVHMSDADE